MNKEYIFITNVRKNELYQVKLVLKQLDINYIITKAEEGDNFRSIYFLNEKENMLKLKDFFELDYKISQRYRKKMIDSGFAKEEELTWDMVTYIGCEKEFFPDRDDTVLRNYIKSNKGINYE